jgi:phospholipid/cholesterol/gamma-HCH transport system ATP-binding protein
MIEIKNLSKSFGEHKIWSDVNLTIEDGDTTAIIGKSGSGKSVLLKHMNALMSPDEGTVLIDGEEIFGLRYVELRLVRQKFGVLFQGGALFDSIDTFNNVAFPLRYFTKMKEAAIKDRVQECLEMVNLGKMGHKKTSELSGGMRKRVGLARAIVMQPRYLLYDEPTSGLDPVTSEEINDMIIHLQNTLNITSVVITHDMHSVLKVADKVAYIDEQKLSWSGTIDEMRTADHESMQEFIKASEYKI